MSLMATFSEEGREGRERREGKGGEGKLGERDDINYMYFCKIKVTKM